MNTDKTGEALAEPFSFSGMRVFMDSGLGPMGRPGMTACFPNERAPERLCSGAPLPHRSLSGRKPSRSPAAPICAQNGESGK